MPITINGSGTVTGISATGISAQPVFPGNVIQVVENSSSTTQSGITTTTSILTASITPSSTSNKIIAMGYCTLNVTATTNAYSTMFLFRGTTSGTQITRQDGGLNSAIATYTPFNAFKLDSPSTTSAQTYTLAVARGSGGTASVSTDGIIYGILLMEVAA
jgi:hypothetical protein